MERPRSQVRGFKPIMFSIGIAYMLLASSMLVRGVQVMRDFATPEDLLSQPVFEDFFLFFYQLMAGYGVLMVLFAQTVRERKAQVLVASVLCGLNALLAWRDLSTSDTDFGNHLYRGSATLIPVFIDVAIALAFGWLAVSGHLRDKT